MADENKRAGWYPDPDGAAGHAGGERWWNGASWSDSRRGGAVAPPPVPVAVVAAAGSVVTPPAVPVVGAPVVYSAANPAPQTADAYGRGGAWTNAVITAAPGRNINVQVNKFAFYGFLCGIISLFFNVLFLLAPLAIVFSIIGISRARQLKAQGAPSTLMNLALVGLGAGALSAVIALVSVVAFFVSSVTIN